jgi:predicted cupin superfamily sugar epimerase
MTSIPTLPGSATPAQLIEMLDLSPHPEGGYFRRTYQNSLGGGARGHATAIYYLLEGGDFAKWHKIDADELWLWHAGAPLTLEIKEENGVTEQSTLGPDVLEGQRPQVLVPGEYWQRARSEGNWTLVSCVVSPGFLFETFEMED